MVGMKEKETEKLIKETDKKQKESLEKKEEMEKSIATPKEEKIGEQREKELDKKSKEEEDFLKTRTEDLSLSSRTLNALSRASIRTVGGLARKREEDLLKVEGLGEKGLNEIRRALGNFGLILK